MRDDFVRVCAFHNSNRPIPFGKPIAQCMHQMLQHREFHVVSGTLVHEGLCTESIAYTSI